MPADGALKPLTVEVVARNPEAFVKNYNSLLDAVAADKIEIKKTDLTDAEIDQKLKDKLNRFMGVVDVEVTDVDELELPETPPEQPMFSSSTDET